jgi:chemotaxis response regulator CheB
MPDASTNNQTPHSLRILIVDDQAFFRRGIREVLNDEEDMQVVAEALDGDEAVRLVRELRPNGLDLVLMDIDMPHLDGNHRRRSAARRGPRPTGGDAHSLDA